MPFAQTQKLKIQEIHQSTSFFSSSSCILKRIVWPYFGVTLMGASKVQPVIPRATVEAFGERS